jgi:uncharacterized protein with von Willebrand factor type A (vWA) domain
MTIATVFPVRRPGYVAATLALTARLLRLAGQPTAPSSLRQARRSMPPLCVSRR